MNTPDPHLATVLSWVGKTYAEMDALYPREFVPRNATPGRRLLWAAGMRGCWNLVRAETRLRTGIELPEEYHLALDQRIYRTVFEPQPWDLVPICNHKLPIVTHVMIVLPGLNVIHAIEEAGPIAHPLTREPWWSRIGREVIDDGQTQTLGRRGYLRLREAHLR